MMNVCKRSATLLLATLSISNVKGFSLVSKRRMSPVSCLKMAKSQLEQLAGMTTLSIDSGDLNVIKKFADTGYITDATTNPLFVAQAGLSQDNPMYSQMISDAVNYAIENASQESEIVALSMERLSVELGAAIAKIVPGYISTEVDPRLSFDRDESIARALRIIDMYQKDKGLAKERVLIKLAATWEGIMAAEVLERDHGIQCNLTLVFSLVQAVACAQRGAHLISPFPGRVLDWYNVKLGRPNGVETPQLDEGVIACTAMYNFYKKYNYDTICMPASWRPSRGKGFELDEIRALAGSDRMTIPPPLLEKLAESMDELPQLLMSETASACSDDAFDGMSPSLLDEKEFRYRMNMDGCCTEKLAEGLRAFIGETEKLEKAMGDRVREALAKVAA